MSQPSDDSWLDQQLRETPLPDGLLERLRDCLRLTDDQLDDELRDVPVPSVILARLHDLPADGGIDAAVATVDVPEELAVSLRQIAQLEHQPVRRSRWVAVGRFVQAASLTAALSAGFLAFLTGWVASSYRTLDGDRGHEIVVVDAPWKLLVAMDRSPPPAVSLETSPEFPASVESTSSTTEILPVALLSTDDLPRSGPVSQWFAARDAGLNPALNVVFLRWGVLASGQRMEDDLPVIERSERPHSAGLQPPLTRGFNRGFWIKHRVQPPLSPAVNELKAVGLPVVTSSRSFDKAERQVVAGVWPSAADLRPEEYLAAAVRYPLPRQGEIDLHLAGGPSRFGPTGVRLLQVGVQAGLPMRGAAPSTHLIVILDASASMARSGRWGAARHALARLPTVMSGADRISLVPFAESERTNFEQLRPGELAGSLAELARVTPAGSFDLAAAIEHAASLALADAGGPTACRRIAVLTDDDSPLPVEVAGRVRGLLQALEQSGVRLDIADAVGGSAPQPHLAELVTWSGGRASATGDASDIYWSLAASLLGQNPLVASEVTVRVEFNPRRVALYRLIGHEANAIATIAPGNMPADLRAAEAATSLFELWLTDGTGPEVSRYADKGTEIAIVKLSWKDAAGVRQASEQKVSLAQFHRGFLDCPASFQVATVAAETAEVLRGSREVLRELLREPSASPPQSTSLDQLLEAVRKSPAPPELAEARGRLNRLLDELKRLRPSK